MKPISQYDLINEAGEFKKLPAGIYPLQIKEVIDKPENEQIEVHFEICGGEFKNYFSTTKLGFGSTIRSYKEKALPFFKAFITAVEKTNAPYQWNWDEKTLAGKFVIGVFGEEEYLSQTENGYEVRVSTKCVEFRSKEAYDAGKVKVPELKKLPDEDRAKVEQHDEPKVDLNIDFPF